AEQSGPTGKRLPDAVVDLCGTCTRGAENRSARRCTRQANAPGALMFVPSGIALACALLAAAAPPGVAPAAPTNTTVIVGPVTVRQYSSPRYRSYWPYFGDSTPIQPVVPSLPSWYTGTIQLPGVTLTPPAPGVPPANPFMANAPFGQAVPQAGELDQALLL